MTDLLTERSYAPLTAEHLSRLAGIAQADHELFTAGHPEYANRRVAVTLAQGAACHYLDGCTGVKDLDVWSFYVKLPRQKWLADSRNRHVDFGPSDLGRQHYDLTGRATSASGTAGDGGRNTTSVDGWTCTCARSTYPLGQTNRPPPPSAPGCVLAPSSG